MSDYIPNEIQREILARLPVKSLLRFTTVCKSWYALITSPIFIASHLNHNLNRTRTTLYNKNNAQPLLIRHFDRHEKEEHYTLRQDDETFVEKFTTLEFPLSIPFGFYRIVGSCMGLVCLSDDLFGDLKNIVIWNPSIRKIVEIEMPKKPEWPHLFVLGFGVCPVTSDPKIVKIAYRTQYSENFVTKYTVPPLVEIYSHKSGTWRNALCPSPPYSMIDFLWSQAFVNGAIHWVANDKRVEGMSRSLVMSFDLVNESFHEIMLPKVLADEHLSHLFVTIYWGFLCVLQYVRDVESCCIWIMREYGVIDSWTEVFTINLPGGVMKVVGFRKNGDILLAMRNNDLVSYNPYSEQMKSLGLVGNIRSFYADTYMENLLLLDGQSQFRDEENQIEEQQH